MGAAKPCPACGEANELDRTDHRSTLLCLACGLGYYEDPAALSAALVSSGYYDADGAMAPEADGERGHKIAVMHKVLVGTNAWNGFGDRIDGFFGRCFEVGFGNGYMMESAKMCRWEVTGCDASNRAVRSAQDRMLNATLGMFDAFRDDGRVLAWDGQVDGLGIRTICPKDHYDLVYGWDSFEHTTDLPAAFRNAAAILAPGGILAVHSPDFSQYMGNPSHPHFNDMSHLWHMSKGAAGRLANAAGLQVLRVEQAQVWGDGGYAHPDNFVLWAIKPRREG